MSALALGLANVSPRFLTDHNFLKTILNFYTCSHLYNQVLPSEFAWVSFTSLHIFEAFVRFIVTVCPCVPNLSGPSGLRSGLLIGVYRNN